MNTTKQWPVPKVRLRSIDGDDSTQNKRQNAPTVNIVQDSSNVGSRRQESRSQEALQSYKDMQARDMKSLSAPTLSTAADSSVFPPSLAQNRRIQRYTTAESELLRRASHATVEPSSRELQIKVLQQATSLLSSYAERSKDHADRLRSLIKDSNGELDAEAYKELKKQRWIEERRQLKLESEKKAANEQLNSLLHSAATSPNVPQPKQSISDAESRRCTNLLKFFANTDSVTLVPISFGKGPATYNSMSAIPSQKRKHTSADGYPLPLESLNSLSSKSAKQRLRASTSALTAPQAPPHGQRRRLRRPTSLILEVENMEASRHRRSPSSSTVRSSPSQLSLATVSDSTHPTPITGEPVMSAYHTKHEPAPPSHPSPPRKRTESQGLDGRYGTATIYTNAYNTPQSELSTQPEVPEVQLPGYAISLINSLDEIHESFSLRPFNARTITTRRASPSTAPAPAQQQTPSKPPPALRSGKRGPPREAKALSTISETPSVPMSKFSLSSSSSNTTTGSQLKKPSMPLRAKSISSFREVLFRKDKKQEEQEEDKDGLKSKVKKRFSGLFA